MQRTPSATTYTFPLPPQAALPPNVQVFSPLPFASLVPSPSQTRQQQGQREPGLLVVSNTGEITFWDQISLSLSGVDRFKSASAPLNPGELVRDLVLLAPTTYLLSTSQARIIAINIVPMAGRADLSVRVLERALGWAGSVWSAVFGAKAVDPRAGILALAASQPKEEGAQGEGERTVYAVMEKDLQVWKVPVRGTGGERLVVELDLFAGVLEALAGEKVGNEQWAMNEGQVEVVDAAVTSCVFSPPCLFVAIFRYRACNPEPDYFSHVGRTVLLSCFRMFTVRRPPSLARTLSSSSKSVRAPESPACPTCRIKACAIRRGVIQGS